MKSRKSIEITDEELQKTFSDTTFCYLRLSDVKRAKELLVKLVTELYTSDIRDVGADTDIGGQDCSMHRNGNTWHLPSYTNGSTRERRCLFLRMKDQFLPYSLMMEGKSGMAGSIRLYPSYELEPNSNDGWGNECKNVFYQLQIKYTGGHGYQYWITVQNFWSHELEQLAPKDSRMFR